MGVFDSTEYVDYTLLKKRGLLKSHEEELKTESKDTGFVDFTAGMSSSSSASSSNTSSPFDLLSNLTSGTGNSASGSTGSYYGNSSSTTGSVSSVGSSTGSDDVNALKLKIEDLEYKIQMLIERMDKMNSTG